MRGMLSRRSFLRFGGAGLAAAAGMLAGAGCLRGGGGGSLPRHVFLLVIDTLRADFATPALMPRTFGRLAREAFVFERAYANSSWTVPSHGSLFTGLPPSRHGAVGTFTCDDLDGEAIPYSYGRLKPEVTTLAEALGAAGFAPLGVSANFLICPPKGFAKGYARGAFLNPVTRKEDGGLAPVDGGTVTRLLVRELERRLAAGRVFAFANYMDVHDPWGASAEDHAAFRELVSYAYETRVLRGRHTPTAGERRRMRALYARGVAYADRQVGLLLAWLADRGAYDDALIVVTADHGEGLGEHRVLKHGCTLDDNLVRVPLLIKPPGGRRRTVLRHVAQLSDLPYFLVRAVGRDDEANPFREGEDPLRPKARDLVLELNPIAEAALFPGACQGFQRRVISPRTGRDTANEARPLRCDSPGDRAAEADAEGRRRLEALGYLR